MTTTFNLILNSFPILLYGLLITLQVAFFAVLIGFVFGFVLGILNSNKFKTKILSPIINFYVLIIRGTPLYVQMLIFYYVLPDFLGINFSPFTAGILALGCNSVAYIAEIVRGGINSVQAGQWDACFVLGYNLWESLLYIILPQMLKNNIPSLTSEVAVLLKDTSVISAIGLMEITRVGMNINARILQPLPICLLLAFLYLILTSTITFISKKIEKGVVHVKG
jgi:polar amino acid transport system permease protein